MKTMINFVLPTSHIKTVVPVDCCIQLILGRMMQIVQETRELL